MRSNEFNTQRSADELITRSTTTTAASSTTYNKIGFSDNNLLAVELSGHSDLQILVNSSLQTISSTVFWIRVSLHFSETEMLQVEDHLNLFFAQYLVQCLDTKNVCYHTTNMDLPPREMKETIFTRHNQTYNKKDTLQALHTSFVNTAIYNMKDNGVLGSRPPPTNHEETLLLRRQRTTL